MIAGHATHAPTGQRALQPEDLLALATITDAQMAPDGSAVAYVVKRADLARNTYTSAIHLVTTADGASRQLTVGAGRDTAPRWSPDGHHLAFLSDRTGTAQLHLLDLAGGEPRRLTDLAREVSSPVWSPDGTRLAVTSATGTDNAEAARDLPGGIIRHITGLRYRFDVAGYTDGRSRHLWIVPLADAAPWRITSGAHDDAAPAWSPDGRHFAFISNREDEVELNMRSQLYTIAVPDHAPAPDVAATDDADGARRIDAGAEQASAPAWSPDGRTVAYIGRREGAPAGGNSGIYLADLAGAATCLTTGWDRSPGTGNFSDTWTTGEAATTLFWTPDGAGVCCTANDRGRVSLFRAALTGGVTSPVGGERTVAFVSISAAGDRLAYVAGDSTNPCDLYTADGGGAGEHRLTAINAALLDRMTLQNPEHHPFTSFDGRFEVDAWQFRPVGAQAGREYPLVQHIHGGPHSVFGHVFFFDMQLWANQGWHVLFINPRASQGYGEEFATTNIGDWGGADGREQEQALDLALARGGVAADQLAVTGLSYGGFMTNWIIGHSDRYRAAASENGICNLVSFHTTSDIGWFWTEKEWGKPVWDNLDFYMAHSPISYVTRVKTPTLFLQTETDWRCPIEQSEQLYTALRSLGVPTEMIRFPGDSHTMLVTGKPASRLARREHTLRWFRRYLAGEG